MPEHTPDSPDLPLKGILVLDFSQFLAGPSASLRLADLGADVIKVERPDGGDLCRRLMVAGLEIDGDSLLFHNINRNKRSFAANLKDPDDLKQVWQLVEHADVMIQNFRPGVIERLGLDYDSVAKVNPRIVYGSITGYGAEGPWVGKPGQDLLAQSISGLSWINGDAEQAPVPVGLAVADQTAGAHLVQGILAQLVRRGVTGRGGKVEASLLESLLDLQFEFITTYLNGEGNDPRRCKRGSASAFLGAPYGVYPTADGFMAVAMAPVGRLGELLECPELLDYAEESDRFAHRDTIMDILARHLSTRPTADWLAILEPADVWCAEVMNWERLFAHEGFKVLEMLQDVTNSSGSTMTTVRCPIRIDGARVFAPRGAPKIGEHTESIRAELGIKE